MYSAAPSRCTKSRISFPPLRLMTRTGMVLVFALDFRRFYCPNHGLITVWGQVHPVIFTSATQTMLIR
jgi:hypothetical protein